MSSLIESTTGHNQAEERSVAKILYLAIGAAVLLGIILFFALGEYSSSFNLFESDNPNTQPPVSSPASPGY